MAGKRIYTVGELIDELEKHNRELDVRVNDDGREMVPYLTKTGDTIIL